VITVAAPSCCEGALDMLILKTLIVEPMHGWGIAQRIRRGSKGIFSVTQGSLHPAVKRLERLGCVSSNWRKSPKKPMGMLLTKLPTAGGARWKSRTRSGIVRRLELTA
jgi:hypothetical protein